jgi:periplasmic copper chaperone A
MNELLRQRARRFLAAIALGASIAVSPALANPPSPNSAPAPKPTIRVLTAWVRWLPAGLPAAGYLTLTNTGDKALALEAASSPSYGDVSIHRTVTRGTTEEMMPVKAITLEPHQTLEFQSTGYHLMLMRPAASADTSAKIPITLHFSDGSVLTVPFEVRKNPDPGSSR